MTAVAGISDGKYVWLAGDSAFSTDDSVWIQRDPKVFKRGPVVIGTAGRARWESLLRYVVDIPPLKRDQEPARWANVDLATAIRKAATQEGYEHESGFIEFDDCAAMVGIAGRLFVVEPDLCCWSPMSGYHAIGSGGEHALVSLTETAGRMQPKARLKRALERAVEKTPFVRPPFSFVSTREE